MKDDSKNFWMQDKVFIRITIGTLLLLMVPFLLMTFKIPLRYMIQEADMK